jgi:hypothetical protein
MELIEEHNAEWAREVSPEASKESRVLVRTAMNFGKAGEPDAGKSTIQLRIQRDLVAGYAKEIDAICLDLFSDFDIPAVPAYLRTGCITLGLNLHPSMTTTPAKACEALQSERGIKFALRYGISEIVIRAVGKPTPHRPGRRSRNRGARRIRIAYI